MGSTFKLDDREPPTSRLPEVPLKEALARLTGAPVEACGGDVSRLHAVRQNALLTAVWQAFAQHRPLVLSPDAVWLCLAQGFAAHMSVRAEDLRGQIVGFAGKQVLQVEAPEFVKGSPHNPWPRVFAEFSRQIGEYVGSRRDLVLAEFSTTGPVERAASELVLLDAMQHYFDYSVSTVCGIPEVTLTGTVDDWALLRRKALTLAEFDLEWWTALLAPLLDEFVAAAAGRPDVEFWRHVFKDSSGSGGTKIRGWILLLFPYVTDGSREARLQQNPVLRAAGRRGPIRARGGPADWVTKHELDPSTIPLGLARAPLRWKYLGETLAMEMLGGFVGIAEDPATFSVRPAIGWAIRDEGAATLVRNARSEAERDGTFLTCEGVACSRGGVGRLILAHDGLSFVPGGATRAVVPTFAGTPKDEDEDDAPGMDASESVQPIDAGALHIAIEQVARFSAALPTRRLGRMTLTFALADGEVLQFHLFGKPITSLRRWCARVGLPCGV